MECISHYRITTVICKKSHRKAQENLILAMLPLNFREVVMRLTR